MELLILGSMRTRCAASLSVCIRGFLAALSRGFVIREQGMDDVRLRPATLDDIDALYRIHRAALGLYVEQTWGWDEGWQAGDFREHCDVSVRHVIEYRGQVIGFMDVIEEEGRTLLASISITPEFQRRGIGTYLILDVLCGAVSRGVPVVLRVLRVNPARSLYERLGFETVGASDTDYTMEAHPARRG
jgi:ribosomal protein S18 acetylase RimI-like enzyme